MFQGNALRAFLICHERIIKAVLRAMLLFAGNFAPVLRRNWREKDVAIKIPVDFGYDQALCQQQRFGKNLRAADDESGCIGIFIANQLQRGCNRADSLDAIVMPLRIAADDDIAPVRQRPTDRIEGLAAHDDRVSGRDALEVRQIGRQMPGQGVVDSDPALGVEGDDDGKCAHG